MEESFEIEKPYSFEYEKIVTDINGQSYLILKGGYRVKALDYQIVLGEIPHTIVCVVKGLNPLRLVQSKAAILSERYPQKNVKHSFRVIGYYYDDVSGKYYYGLEDELSLRHRYYTDERTLDDVVGDSVDLWVLGVVKKSWSNAYLELSVDSPKNAVTSYRELPAVDDGPEVIVSERENSSIEFKSSLVFPAATSEADIDTQTRIIMQALAGMMNADGGTLYIGLDNFGRLSSGIEPDFDYLNNSQIDKFNDYAKTDDGYELKLQNSVSLFLGPYAKTNIKLIAINEGERTKKKYVMIVVAPSDWPVWVNGKDLFVRTGNNTTHFRGDNITKFIIKKMGLQLGVNLLASEIPNKEVIEPDPFAEETIVPQNENNQSDEMPSIPSIKPVPATIDLFENERVWRYLYLMEGGGYLVKEPSDPIPDKFVFKVAIPADSKSHKGYNLVICYDNGDTDWVGLHSALYRNESLLSEGSKGWNPDKTVVSAFCLRDNKKRHDLVAFVSAKDGVTSIKCNTQKSLGKNPHKQLGNTGNKMLENKSELLYAMRVSGEGENRRALESLSLVFEDRINHTNGIPVDALPETSRMLLENVLSGLKMLSTTAEVETLEVMDSAPITNEIGKHIETDVHKDTQKGFNQIWLYNGKGTFLMRFSGVDFEKMNAFISQYPDYKHVREELTRKYPILRKTDDLFVFRLFYEGKVSYDRLNKILSTVLIQQSRYLKTGDERLHVILSQSDISRITDIEDSGVSRGLSSFDLITKNGILSKKDLISDSGKDGHSRKETTFYIKKLLDEYHAKGERLTSLEISELLLKRYGIRIADRTVRKYLSDNSQPTVSGTKSPQKQEVKESVSLNDQDIVEQIKRKLQRRNKPRVLVVYPNGQYIYENSSVSTMLEVIKKSGIMKVRGLGLIGREGRGKTPRVEFISTTPYYDGKDGTGETQVRVGRYYVFKKYSISMIIAKIKQISDGLNLGLYCEEY